MSRRVAVFGLAFAFTAAFLAIKADAASAPKLDSEAFVAACTADEVVTTLPGFDDGKVTPKQFCDCVAGKLQDSKLSQKDVDMLTKMHKDAITDDEAANFPTLEDLLSANEGFEDACKKTLGLPAASDDGEAPDDEMPADEAPEDDQPE